MPKLDDKKFITGLILFGILLRFVLWNVIPVTTDSAEHFSKARYIAQEHDIPVFEYVTGNDPYWYPPLFHIITAFIYKLTGVLTLTPLLAGSLSLIVFYYLAKKFYPQTLPYSLILLTFLPFHAYMSGIGYTTILLFLWATIGYYYYLKYLQTKYNTYLLFTILACTASALTHYHGLLLTAIILTHFFFQKPKQAITSLIAILILISPWYVRNYIIFGNPIWPLFFEGNYVHGKTGGGYGASGLMNFLRPSTYSSVFFDFWIGAPNSGEDVFDNISKARNIFPVVFEVGLIFWLLSILAWSFFVYRGVKLFFSDRDFLPLISFLFSFCIIAFLPAARTTVFCIPFAIIAAAKGLSNFSIRQKTVLFIISFFAFTGVTISYAFVYNQVMSKYIPFYHLMEENLPSDARIVMPYTLQHCIYYTSKECVRDRNFPGGVPPEIVQSNPADLEIFNITHFCCDSLWWDARNPKIRNACQMLADDNLVLDYEKDGVWGKCWLL
jgi:hypothetical protein